MVVANTVSNGTAGTINTGSGGGGAGSNGTSGAGGSGIVIRYATADATIYSWCRINFIKCNRWVLTQ